MSSVGVVTLGWRSGAVDTILLVGICRGALGGTREGNTTVKPVKTFDGVW